MTYTYRNVVRDVQGMKGGALCVLVDDGGDLKNVSITAATMAANTADVAALTAIAARRAELETAAAAASAASTALDGAAFEKLRAHNAVTEGFAEADTLPPVDAAFDTAQAAHDTAANAVTAIVDDIAAKLDAADAAIGATVVAAVNDLLAATGQA